MSSDKAKVYSTIRYGLVIIETIYLLVILLVFTASGSSQRLAALVSCANLNPYFILPLYILLIYLAYYVLNFPLNFYHSFILEHRFSLTHQKINDWFGDQIKGSSISYIISLIFLEVFYYILKYNPKTWWLAVSLFWIFFSLILSKLVPILIIPLFFKYKELSDQSLKERILKLADKMRIGILDVFEIDFSKKTQKGNAAFVGWGKSRRVILADTLKDKYSADEIEVILAHEFAHYRLRHLIKLVLINSIAIILSFYLIHRTSGRILGVFHLSSLSDIAAMPVIFLYIIILGIIMQPLENYLSRMMERNADMLALEITGLKGGFISMMEKLAAQNLADRSPAKIIKIFFFDHPPVDERIALARTWILNSPPSPLSLRCSSHSSRLLL